MKLTLQEITKIIDGKLNGGPDVIITGAGDIDSALPGQIIFIKNKEYSDSLKIAEILLNDKHDLIHKAVGWMLREIGKRDLVVLEEFLKDKYQRMPRTMLRYAIERFPEAIRLAYLKGTI